MAREWLRELRTRKNLTQEMVAECVGISRSYYTKIETDDSVRMPTVTVIKKLAKVLEFEWETFYNDEVG